MTDPEIAEIVFREVIGRDGSDEERAAAIAGYLSHLEEAVNESDGYRVMPGIEQILPRLRRGSFLDRAARGAGLGQQAHGLGHPGGVVRVTALAVGRERPVGGRRRAPRRGAAGRRARAAGPGVPGSRPTRRWWWPAPRRRPRRAAGPSRRPRRSGARTRRPGVQLAEARAALGDVIGGPPQIRRGGPSRRPPSTVMIAPVVQAASGSASWAIHQAISSGWPRRPSGTSSRSRATRAS